MPPTRILVVEDDPVSARMLRHLLENRGHEVTAAADGFAALEMARAAVPGLIVLDIGLPHLSGLEVAKFLKQDRRTARVPILAVSACELSGEDAATLDGCCEGFLAKPLSIRDFLTAVERLTAG